MRWVVSGRTSAVLGDTTFRKYSKHLAAFLCRYHPAFSSNVSLESRWCNHTLVLIRLFTNKNRCIILSKRSGFHRIDNLNNILSEPSLTYLLNILVNVCLFPFFYVCPERLNQGSLK